MHINRAGLIKLLIFLFILVFFTSQSKTTERTIVKAGRSVYRGKIKRLVMETKDNFRPTVIKKNSTLMSKIIIYDELNEVVYAFTEVDFQNTNVATNRKNDKTVLKSEQATYNTKKDIVNVWGEPYIEFIEDKTNVSLAKSKSMKIYNDDNYIIMNEDATISNNRFFVSGNLIKVFNNEGIYTISGNAKTIESNSIMTANFVKIYTTNNKLLSYNAKGNVYIENSKDGFTIYSETLNYDRSAGFSTFIKNVNGYIISKETNTNNGVIVIRTNRTDFKADRFNTYNDSENRIVAYTGEGNVEIILQKEEMRITAGFFESYKDTGYTKFTDRPVIYFIGKNTKASANTIEKYDEENKANLNGNIVIDQGNQKAYGRWGEYRINEKIMEITGDAVMQEGDKKFSAQKIIVDIEKDTMRMIGRGSGRIN